MKRRGTIAGLLLAVVAVWGAVAWKIMSPAERTAVRPSRPASAASIGQEPDADTLCADYPDPFLKGAAAVRKVRAAVRPLPAPPGKKAVRENVRIVHLGSVAAAGRRIHIVRVGERQYELSAGDSADGFVLAGSDRDSLYLRKNGFTYGVPRCR